MVPLSNDSDDSEHAADSEHDSLLDVDSDELESSNDSEEQ